MVNVKGFVKRQLTKREDKRYERLLRSRRTTYGQWVQAIEARSAPEPIDLETRRVQNQAGDEMGEAPPKSDEFVVICGSKGFFWADMRSCVKPYLARHPEAMVLYGD